MVARQGGERQEEFKDVFPERTVATEGYEPNLILAHKRLLPLGISVVASNDSLQQLLPFADESFDLVISRHISFNIAEVEQPWTFFTMDYVLEQIA